MRQSLNNTLWSCGIALACIAPGAAAQAQGLPSRPIMLVVRFVCLRALRRAVTMKRLRDSIMTTPTAKAKPASFQENAAAIPR